MRKKFFSLLVLLAVVATGAEAQTETLLTTITATAKEQASYSTANVATVSFSYTAYGASAYLANWGWWGYGWIATVNAAEGYTITKCIFYDDANRTATDSEAPFVVETTEEDKTPRINGTPIDGGIYQSKGLADRSRNDRWRRDADADRYRRPRRRNGQDRDMDIERPNHSNCS